MRKVLLLSRFSEEENKAQREMKISNITQQGVGDSGIQIQKVWHRIGSTATESHCS